MDVCRPTEQQDYSVKTQIRAMEIRCAPPKPMRKTNTMTTNAHNTHYTTETPGSKIVWSADQKRDSKNSTDPGVRCARYVEAKDNNVRIETSNQNDDGDYSDIDDGERDSNYEVPMNYHATYIPPRDGRKGRQRDRGSFIARKMKCEIDFNSQTMVRMCIISSVLLILVIILFVIYAVVTNRACPLPPPADCAEILRRDSLTPSGVYIIRPRILNEDVNVYCDMETAGGGWTVIQRRKDGSQDFDKDWFEYKQGFGDVSNEFWLGNEKIHFLTLQGHYVLRIDMKDFKKRKSFVEYSYFWISSETDFYELTYSKHLGGIGATDRLAKHKGMAFSTTDRDHDLAANLNCAKSYHGGWWFNSCKDSNLNGNYFKSGIVTKGRDDGVTWDFDNINRTSLIFSEMKVRPDIF
ncbi:techylectin-5B-like [Anneissia japonica]|uniref:techylectin-5B-like n=1 Tax=Anneissia japonica TaxID=1529436 RepID=UPI0014258308|nr:techylectin-5B-like [Anneissia japonica]